MTPEPIAPKLKENGTVDSSSLEGAGDLWIYQWLKGRLSGRDIYFPVDIRLNEDPEALVVGLLRELGNRSQTFTSIARSIRSLLYEAREYPDAPRYLFNALRICHQVYLPETRGWFEEELNALTETPSRMEERWSASLIKDIAYAAVLQIPAMPISASRGSWLRLLRSRDYTTLALRALGARFYQQLPHLTQWWAACPEENRERELDQMMSTALKTSDDQEIRSLLQLHAEQYPTDLKEAVNKALRQNGGIAAFKSSRSYQRALSGAASVGSHNSILEWEY